MLSYVAVFIGDVVNSLFLMYVMTTAFSVRSDITIIISFESPFEYWNRKAPPWSFKKENLCTSEIDTDFEIDI